MTSARKSEEENVGEILVVWQKYKANGPEELDLCEGDLVELLDTEDPAKSPSKRIKLDPELDNLADKSSLLNNAAARHKLSVKPLRRHASSRYSPTRNTLDTRWLVKQINGSKKQGWVPCNILQSTDEPKPGTGLPGDAAFRRQAVVKELVETENEFVKDLDFVVQEYLVRTESTKVPKVIKDNLELVFGGLVEIANFHRTVLMEGVKYYANEPNLLGKAFLRLERDFDKHVKYCTDEPIAQGFLDSCEIARDYFDDLSQRLGDDKNLSEHLKLPIQRINDYQLLLKELVRYSECLGENCANLQNALELMLSIPNRAEDDKFTSSIEGYRGSIYKLGRLISHDWFSVTFGNIAKERYLFLFKARILITKVRRISEDRSIFQLKDIIRLPQIEIKDHPDDKTFELVDKIGGHSLILASRRDHVKELWLKEIREFASDVDDQTEELQIVSEATSTLTSDVVPTELKPSILPQASEAQKLLASALKAGLQEKKVAVAETPKAVEEPKEKSNKDQNYNNVPLSTPSELKQEVQVAPSDKDIPKATQSSRNDQKEEEKKQSTDKVTSTKNVINSTTSDLSSSQLSETTHSAKLVKEVQEISSTQSESYKSIENQSTTETLALESIQSQNQKKLSKIQVVESIITLTENASLEIQNQVIEDQKSEASISISEHKLHDSSLLSDTLKNSSDTELEEVKVKKTVKKKLQFVELTKEVESSSSETLKSCQSETSESSLPPPQQLPSPQPTNNCEGFGERNPDEPPIPVPIPPPPPVKPHHNKIEVSVVETQIGPVNLGVQISVEVDDDKMSRRYSGKGGEDYDSSFSRRSVKRSSYTASDGLSSTRHESSLSGKYGSESISSKYGSDALGSSKYGAEALMASKYSTESSISNKYGTESVGSKYGTESVGSKYGDYSSKYGEGETGSLGYTRKSLLSDTEGLSGSKHILRRSVTEAGNEDGTNYSRKYHSESIDSGDVLGSYNRKYGSDLGDGGESFSYSRKSVSAVESGNLGDSSRYSSRKVTSTESSDGGASKYARKSYSSYKSGDDTEEDILGKYSRKDKEIGYERQDSTKRSVSINEDADVLSKFSKYERRISETKKIVCEADEEEARIEAEMRKKYGPNVSVDFKGDEAKASVESEEKSFSRSESKEYKRSESKEYKRSESKESKRSESSETKASERRAKSQISTEEEGLIKVKNIKTHETSETTKIHSNEERRDSGPETKVGADGAVSTTFKIRRESSVIEGKPSFKRRLSGTNVEPGESAVFEVELSIPTDNVTWLKDNRPLRHLKRIKTTKSEEGVCRLEIKEAEVHDVGLYSAIATNSIGNSTCSAQLIVHELTEQERAERLVSDKPVFLVQLKDTELLEDTYLRFMVKVKGDPTPKISFFKDDIQIQENDEKYHIVREASGKGFYELVIPQVQHSDAGKYKCLASNKFGEASSEATITVTDFKNIFGDLSEDDPLLAPGEKPAFYWKKDGNIFEPEERFKVLLGDDEDSLALVFQHVRPEDAGLYTCVAQTSSGHISCSAELTVHGVLNQLLREPEKPQLVVENKEACASVGNSAMLELQVKGYPKPQIKWTHDGKPIEPGGKYKFLYEEDEESMSLVIKNVEPVDAGAYFALAENELGSDTAEMTLTVKAPPKIKTKFEDVSVAAGITIRIPVEVEGMPKPTLKFYKDGQEIKISERIKIVEEGNKQILVIEKSNVKDAGSYSVVASNEISQSSGFWNVDVYSPPKITKGLGSNKIVSLKEEVVLSVTVEAKPEAEVTWYKNDVEISSDKHYILKKDEDSYFLKITGTVSTDSASYKVKAKNIHGSVDDECQINVKVPPKLIKGLSDMTVVEHQKNVELDVKVEAFPKPTIKWYFDEMEISESRTEFTRIESDDGSKLVIKEVTSDLSGKYKCKLVNELGETETSAKLTVNCKPRFVKVLKDTTIDEGATLHLEVEVEACPEPSVKWLRNGREVTTDARIKITRDSHRYETYHLAVDLIKYEEQGEYEVVVTNSLGTVSSRSIVTVQKVIHTDAIEETEPPKKQKFKIEVVDNEEEVVIEELKVKEPDVAQENESDEGFSDEKNDIVRSEPIVEEPYSPEDHCTKTNLAKSEFGVITTEEDAPKVDHTPRKSSLKGKLVTFDTTKIEEVEDESENLAKTEFEIPAKCAEEGSTKNNTDNAVENGNQFVIIEEDFSEENVAPEKSEIIFSTNDENGKPKKATEMLKPKLHRGLSREAYQANLMQNEIKTQFSVEEELAQPQTPELDVGTAEPLVEEVCMVNQNLSKASTTENVPKKYERALSAQKCEQKLLESEVETKVDVSEVNLNGSLHGDENYINNDSEQESIPHKNDKHEAITEALPKILESNLKDQSQFESLDVCYVVKATANPKPTAVWTRDDKPLKAGTHLSISESGDEYKLEIKQLEKKDAGVYQCKIVNPVGDAKTQAKLTVIPEAELRRPKVKEELIDKTILKSNPAKLSTVIVGEPVPDVTWCVDGKEIKPEQFEKYKIVLDADDHDIENDIKECTFSLSIPKSEQENSGKYKIKAKNKWGECESSAQLTIVFRPEIEGPKDIHVVPGESGEFSATVIAHPAAKVTWYKDGKPLESKKNVKIEEHVKNNLYKVIFENIELGDEGKYQIIAKNEIGEATADTKLKTIKEVGPTPEKPYFITALSNAEVEDGEEIILMVRADGIPKPEVCWYFNGTPLDQDEDHKIVTKSDAQITSTLTIPKYSLGDIGQYKAVATNIVGETETVAKISMVQRPPSFGKMLDRAQDVNEGEPLKLVAKVSGSPKPTIAWLKNGEPIVGDHIQTTISPDGTVKLYIDKVKPSDSGAYKLVIKNPNGESSSLCAVAVTPKPQRPKFLKCIKDVQVTEGQPIRLDAQVSGYPPPEIRWEKDGVPIRPSSIVHLEQHPDGNVALIVDCVKPENAGTYTLIATNKLGEGEIEAKVTIDKRPTKPEFITRLQPMSVVEGFPARLEVKTKSFPPAKITWTRNGVEVISDNQHIKITDLPDGSSVLLIDACDIQRDPMAYKAIASNEAGETESSGILSVTPATKEGVPEAAPMFLTSIRDAVADEGQPLVIEVPFTANPIPKVEWFKDDQPIEPSDSVLLTCDGKKVGLHIDNCSPSDAGKYSVKLTNPLGSDISDGKAVIHKVFSPPRFTQRFTDTQQLLDHDAKLAGKVSGVPTPEITWFKDGSTILPGDKYKMKTDGDLCSLYIHNCQPSDIGLYRAFAVNKEGSDTCEAQLSVVDEITTPLKAEAPTFLKRIGDMDLYKGMTAKFTACASGFPEPTVEWFRNDKKLKPSDRIKMEMDQAGLLRLTISKISEDDLGKYSCKISNEHGSDICYAKLQFDDIDAKPRKPISDEYTEFDKHQKSGIPVPLSDPPIISRMTERHCTLSWKPSVPSYARAPVTYQLEMCELPHGDWFTARSGIRNCDCTVGNLEPFRDYRFRIRIENKYGISDPSPYANTFRQKLEPDPPKFNTHLPLGIPFHPDSSPYFPHDFDIERPPHDNMAQSPRFLRQEHPTQYGMKDQNSNLFWYIYGYPKPKMEYFFNDEPIESGGRFDTSYTRNGQATLFINKMLERDVGWYEAVATNEHGIARQRVRLEIAEFPEFIRRPEIQYSMIRGKARFEARIIGKPYPEIKWYKDWKPVVESSRVKIKFIEPDLCIFTIDDVILRDLGLYSVSARNVAGSISSSAMLYVDESDSSYKLHTYSPISVIKSKKKLFEDFFDIGDELGRGTQGITYHAVDRSNGYNYAAKIMHGRGEFRPFMFNELDVLNQLRHRRLISLHEAYESEDRLVLLLELGGGGELVKDYLLRRDYYCESEIAGYIRQILQGFQYMHERGYGHMGLNIGDILLTHPGSSDIKITDFSLSRRITSGNLYPLWYGVPEYVCPEGVKGEGTGYGQDMWSIGIITYILLSGRSPFLGKDDRETLNRIIDGSWSFDMDWWCNISLEGRDFISKLLVYDSSGRLDINAALRHPWLERADRTYRDEYQISTKYLHNYYHLYREWYDNASCRRWFRRRKLETAFTHPSRMVYPPGESYTPPPSPSPQRKQNLPLTRTWEEQLPSRSPLNYEIGLFKSESHYQNGPDTYLLQLRDVSFPVRVREYMKVAANRGPGRSLVVSNENGFDWETPVVRERRRFTDIMDEEIDDERKARINRYGSDNVASYSIRRLRRELGPRLDTYAEAEAMIESKQDGRLPFFREKPQVTAMVEGREVDLTCFVVGDPQPVIQWFKNDAMVVESARVSITTDSEGRTHFKLSPALGFDIGMYRVVARNKVGQTVAWTRIVYGQVPDSPDSPQAIQVSDTEILLTWKAPKHDGNSAVLCYSLQYKLIDGTEWIKKVDNIDHEFYLMSNLEQNKQYLFRLAACNAIGWSEQGVTSAPILTLKTGAPRIELSTAMRHLQQITDSGKSVEPEVKLRPDYSLESKPVEWTSEDPTQQYEYISEINKGHYSNVLKAIEKKSDKLVVAKLLDNTSERTEHVDGEFAALRSLRHERIAGLLAAYRTSSDVSTFIMEKLQGSNVLTYLASKHEYTEETVATIVSQVLDGLQYLHWRNLCHLDIQPDNVVMCGLRSIQVKLVDFGCAHRVTKLGTKVPVVGHPDYISPEVLNEELAYPQTDIWSLGVLTYLMLSGVLPFQGQDTNETRQNISFVRYRFEYLYQELSQEGSRFIMMIFKRHPNKRPTAEECHENRWLLPLDSMIKKRERAVFLGSRLKECCEKYNKEKVKSEGFRTVKSDLAKSLSIQEELLISP